MFARFRRSADPLLEYVNFVHYSDGTFKPIAQIELSSSRGSSVVRGFSNTQDAASPVGWASVWTLEAHGTTYEIENYKGPATGARIASYAGHPAAYIAGDVHQGEGWDAKMWIYDDGRSYRLHSETSEFTETTRNPQTSDGDLKLKLIAGLSAMRRSRGADAVQQSQLGSEERAKGAQKTVVTAPPSNEALGRKLPEAEISARLKGTWVGEMVQPGFPPFPVAITLTEVRQGAICGTVEHSSLHCAGSLRCIELRQDMCVAEQVIESGRDRCLDGLNQLIPQDQRKLLRIWISPDTGLEGARGILSKVE